MVGRWLRLGCSHKCWYLRPQGGWLLHILGHSQPQDVGHADMRLLQLAVAWDHGTGGFFVYWAAPRHEASAAGCGLGSRGLERLGGGFTTIFVSYRLAPQHRFPAQFEDSISAVKFFLQDKILMKYGVDPTRICISGDSSGGNLAAAVTQQPLLLQLWSPICQQPWSCCPRSHALMALAPLTPDEGMQRLGPATSVGVSDSCCPDHPSGARDGGEALRGDQGWQLLLPPADDAERLGLALGTGSRYEQWLQCQLQVRAGPVLAVGMSRVSTSSRYECRAGLQHVGAKKFQ
ncbi:hypothetical protein QTO34_014781 [Cnephaeus nilssonii]|uniref:Alpha/beta hydrolase fold-3 domain-containing protein n=1 Tax=Cnephaeus nilssonii TaxID=3371016 RepID=A0AA40I779_CNENI|nr:hypothetical protein QTO34_014781 [Eptesicus nilssonii]